MDTPARLRSQTKGSRTPLSDEKQTSSERKSSRGAGDSVKVKTEEVLIIQDESKAKQVQLALPQNDAYEPTLTSIETETTLITAGHLREQYFPTAAVTLLEGGHPLSEDGSEMLDPICSTLVVPQETVVHLAIADRNSISPFKLCVPACSTVGTLKQRLLRCSLDFQNMSLYDMLGCCLKNDAQPLSETALYAHRNCKLICLQQIEENADNVGIPEEKLEAVLELSSRWSAIAVGEQPTQLARKLHQSIETVLVSIDDHLEAPQALQSSTYSCAGLTRPEPPVKGASPELDTAKARFAALLAPANSECPARATALLNTLANELGGFSPGLAGQCAGAVQCLLELVEFLASRAPREHRHAAHRDNIRESRDALDSHRAIRAEKLPQYIGSDNMEAMLSAREATESRMCRAGDDLNGLLEEWDDVSRWADMTRIEPAHETAVEGAGRAVAAAVAAAQAAAESEEGVRSSIAGLAREAERQRDLVQAQIRQCTRVAEAGERRAAEDADRLRRQLRALLDQLAQAEVLRRLHARRRLSLRALAEADDARHLAFAQECGRQAAIADQRVRVAQTGASAAVGLREGLGELEQRLAEEMARFKARGDELLLDVAADCAETQAIAHSASHVLEHYAREALVGEEEAKGVGEQQFRLANLRSNKEEMARLQAELRAQKQKMRQIEDRADELRAEQERLISRTAAPWALLRRKALGDSGRAEEGGAAGAARVRVRVRTSAANLEAWGVGERVVEGPEEWNQAMREEAAALKTLLLGPGQ